MTAGDIKAALVTVLTTALAADTAVQVTSGVPDPSPMPDVVAVLGSNLGTDREEETAEFALVVSCYVGGGVEAQATATSRAYSLLATAVAALVANPTLSGACRVAAVEPVSRLAETVAYSGDAPIGRLAEVTVTVTAWTGRTLLGSLYSAHSIP